MKKPERTKFRQETVIHSYIHRPISIEIIRLIWNTNITANQITSFRMIFNISALVAFAQGTVLGFILGFIAFQINEILDHVDGMYSRLKNQTSKFGAFCEVAYDNIFAGSQGLLGLSVAYGACKATGNFVYIWIFISMAIGYGLYRVFQIEFERDEICRKDSFHNIDHDSEEYRQLLGVPLRTSLKNAAYTIAVWRNEVLVWGALFFFAGLKYKIDLICIALLFHSLVYQFQWIKIVWVAYQKALKLDGGKGRE